MKKITLFNLLMTLILLVSTANAEVYNKFIADIDTECTNFGVPKEVLGNSEVNIDHLDITYDDVAHKFSIEVKVDKTSGKLAKFFHFGVTNGAMPGGEGAIAHIYFDANILTNPVATIYAYNGRGMPKNEYGNFTADTLCGNSYGSWKKANMALTNSEWNTLYGVNIPLGTPHGVFSNADKIFSSKNDTNGIFTEVSVNDLGADAYIYRLVINTNTLNTYVPSMFKTPYDTVPSSRSYTYKGAKFDDLLGLWFWAAADATSAYSGDYLSSFNTSAATCAICDQSNFETKRYPKCTGVELSSSKVVAGNPIVITFNVNDPDKNDTEPATISVNYTGVPTGAIADPANSEIVLIKNTGDGSAKITWTPEQKDVATYKIKASFAKDYGLDQLVSVPEADGCIAEFEVEPIVPFCKVGDPEPIASADSNSARINNIALELDRRTKRNTNSILKAKGQPKIDFGSAPLDGVDTDHLHFKVVWPAYNSIQATDGHTFVECTNTQYCEGGAQVTSLASEVTTFNDGIDTLNDTALVRAKKFEEVRREYLRVVLGYSPREARRRARAAAAKYVRGSDGVNVNYNSAVSDIEFYTNTYGLDRIQCTGAQTEK